MVVVTRVETSFEKIVFHSLRKVLFSKNDHNPVPHAFLETWQSQ